MNQNSKPHPLSCRLKRLLSMIPDCDCLADIGCDHAYLPIEAVRSGKAKRAIACDLRKGPLASAETNIRAAGLEECITLYLADGIPKEMEEELVEGERNLLLISGMGAELMLRILEKGKEILPLFSELLLSPQSEWMLFRKRLNALGYRIIDEHLLSEDGKMYYHLLAVGGHQSLSETEAYAGPVLLQKKSPELAAHLKKRKQSLALIHEEILRHASESAAKRLREVMKERKLIDETQRLISHS